jgi:hypothetical protein
MADGRTDGRKKGRNEGRKEGRNEGRKEGRTEGRKEGRKEGTHLELSPIPPLGGLKPPEGRKEKNVSLTVITLTVYMAVFEYQNQVIFNMTVFDVGLSLSN